MFQQLCVTVDFHMSDSANPADYISDERMLYFMRDVEGTA
jgi:hypothetical protein